MTKTALKIVFGIIVSLGLLNVANALTVLYPVDGGTGTSTSPSYGQILVGNNRGTYSLTATSSLGIIGAADGNFSTTSADFWGTIRETVCNVTKYGAVGDNSTDNYTAITNAIAACPEGGTVFFPAGIYRVSQTITLTKRNITLEGTHAPRWSYRGGMPTSIKPTTPFTGSSIIHVVDKQISGEANENDGGRIRNLAIDGNSYGTVDGIYFEGLVRDWKIENVDITNPSRDGFVTAAGSGAGSPRGFTIKSLSIYSAGRHGFRATSLNDSYVEDLLTVGNAQRGIYLTTPGESKYVASRAVFNGLEGLVIDGTTTNGGVQFVGFSTDRNDRDGIKISATGTTTISFTDLLTRRDGANTSGGTETPYAGVKIIGTAGNKVAPVVINGLTQILGVDDNGSGTQAPNTGVRSEYATYVSVNGSLWGVAQPYLDNGNNDNFIIGEGTQLRAGYSTPSVTNNSLRLADWYATTSKPNLVITKSQVSDFGGPYLTVETDPVWTADKPNYLTIASAGSTYVPYTGATGNVNLGTNTLFASSTGSSDNPITNAHFTNLNAVNLIVSQTATSGYQIVGGPSYPAQAILKLQNQYGSNSLYTDTDGRLYVAPLTISGNATTTGNLVVGTINGGTIAGNNSGDQDLSPYLTSATAGTTYIPLTASTTAATANTLVLRDSNGDTNARYVNSQYVNMSHSASARNADTVFYSSTDNYIRKNTLAGFKTSLGLNLVDNLASTSMPVSTAQRAALDLKIDNSTTSLPLLTSVGNAIKISSGNVGIGTTTPASGLTVSSLAQKLTGTFTWALGSNVIVGVGSSFTTELAVGDTVKIMVTSPGVTTVYVTVVSIADNTHFTAGTTNGTASASGSNMYKIAKNSLISLFDDENKIDYNLSTGVSGNNALELSGNGTPLMAWQNGEVGIGIANPTSDVHMYKSASSTYNTLLIENTGTAGNRGGAIELKSNATNPRGRIEYNGSVFGMKLGTTGLNNNGDLILASGNFVERMRILGSAAGSVGIGTSTPRGTLEVYGNSNGLVRSYFTNGSTGAATRQDIAIGNMAGNSLYIGTDMNNVFGTGNRAYLDNRTGGNFVITTVGTPGITLDTSNNTTIAGTLASGAITSSGLIKETVPTGLCQFHGATGGSTSYDTGTEVCTAYGQTCDYVSYNVGGGYNFFTDGDCSTARTSIHFQACCH